MVWCVPFQVLIFFLQLHGKLHKATDIVLHLYPTIYSGVEKSEFFFGMNKLTNLLLKYILMFFDY